MVAKIIIIALLLFSGNTFSNEIDYEFSGVIAYEPRWFINDAQFDDQFNGVQNSFVAEPELFIELGNQHQFSFVPFIRYDARDNDRTHADIREAYWRYIDDDKELLIGVNREFWGVTESRHLVNIINQIDQVEDIDEEDFLGQLMLSASIQKNYGRFSFFVLPLFRERTFPSSTGRLRGPLVIDEDAAEYESGAEQWHTDLALRYSHYLGNWDIGASYFYGTGREPTLILNEQGTRLIPEYEIIHQLGLDLQYTNEEWLWKFESILREGQGYTFAATVFGFEYTVFQVFNSNADFGFLVEHLYDGRDPLNAPIAPFDNDLFIAMRYTLNDINDTNILAGALTDLENESNSLRLEADRRIGNYWRIELQSQWFSNTREGTFNGSVKDDDFTVLNLSRYF